MTSTGGITAADLLARVKPKEVTVKVLPDPDLVAQHAALELELVEARRADDRVNREPQAPGLARRLVELEEAIDGSRVVFMFRSIGRHRWIELLAKHPPTKEQKRQYPQLDHNPLEFPALAISASCVSPELTVDEAGQLEESLNETQWQEIYQACLEANVGGDANPKSLLAGMILNSNASSEISAASGESLAASSLVE